MQEQGQSLLDTLSLLQLSHTWSGDTSKTRRHPTPGPSQPPHFITIISSFNRRAAVTPCSKTDTHHLMENHLLVDIFLSLSLLFVDDHPSPRFNSGRPPTDEFSKPRQFAGSGEDLLQHPCSSGALYFYFPILGACLFFFTLIPEKSNL